MIVKADYPSGKFEAVWKIDKDTTKFDAGKKKERPRVVTTCQIYHLTERGKERIGIGVTYQGRKDSHCEVECRKHSMTRALKTSFLSKGARTAFWKEFHLRFGRIEKKKVCPHKVVARGNAHDWCVKYKRQCAALGCKTFAIGGQVVTLPVYDLDNMPPEELVFPNHPIVPKSLLEQLPFKQVEERILHHKRVFPVQPVGGMVTRYGLGWKKITWRSRSEKEEQYRRIYGVGNWRQAEERCHRVGEQPITIINKVSPEHVLDDKVMETVVKKVMENAVGRVVDETMSRRLSGITDADKAEKLTGLLKKPKRDGLLRRCLRWVWSGPAAMVILDEIEKAEERDLYGAIAKNHCDTCGREPVSWHSGPEAGNCQNISCGHCGQKYWLDTASRTASKIEEVTCD